MKFSLELVRDADLEPFTLAQVKTEIRAMTLTAEDAKITRLLTAGRQWFEDRTGLALVDQTWRLCIGPDVRLYQQPLLWRPTFDYYYGDWSLLDDQINLRRSPVLSIVGVVDVAADGTRTTVAADTYQLRDATSKWPNVIGLSSLIGASEETQITFRAGYADRTGSPTQDASVIPAQLLQPIILWIQAMYDQDKDMMEKTLRVAEQLADRLSVNMNFA